MNSSLKYRTFDELLADCMVDFRKYNLEGLIEPAQLVKVARRCNYELGLRIYRTREVVLDVDRGRAKLPDDYYAFNFALLLGRHSEKVYLPQGTQMEERIVGIAPEYQVAPPKDIDFCADPVIKEADECMQCCDCPDSCTITCKGEIVQLVQKLKYETRVYEQIVPVTLLDHTEDFNGFCDGKYWESPFSATIREGWIYTSFQTGKLYINYEGDMVDEEGNILVPDHELLNEYYEYAIKQRIIENLIMNDLEVSADKLTFIEQRYRAARNNAMSLVNMPNFKELKSLFQANRNAFLSRYYDMFTRHHRIKGH